MSNESALKTLIASGFILLPLALSALIGSQAKNAEIDIFAATPIFWVLMLSAASAFIASIVWQAHHHSYSKFKLAFFGLAFCSVMIFCLPVLRGYLLYGGNDPNGQLGTILSMLQTGSLSLNYYPVGHILTVIIALFTSLPPEVAFGLVMPIFSLLFSLFIFCLATAVFTQFDRVALATALGFVPFLSYYHVVFYPNGIAVLLFPLAFYLLLKSFNDLRYGALLILVLLISPFTHPIPAFILALCLFSAYVADAFLKATGVVTRTRVSGAIGLFALVTWFAWWSAQAAFSSVFNLFWWLIGESQQIPRVGELQPLFGLSTGSLIQLALKMYGVQIAGIAVSLIALAMIASCVYRKRKNLRNYFIIAIVAITSAFSNATSFLSIGATTVGRLLGANAAYWAIPVLVALPLSLVTNKRKYGVWLVGMFIIASFAMGSFATFRSPWMMQPNWHFSYQDAAAFQWSQSLNKTEAGFAEIATPWGRIPTGTWYYAQEQSIPPHFGYDNHTLLRESLLNDSFLVFGDYRQREVSNNPTLSTSPINGLWGFPGITEADVNKLQNDRSVNVIYSTGGDKILFVK